MVEEDKARLVSLAAIVHNAVRKLKMGDVGVISVTRTFSADAIIEYARAYAFYKGKWFDFRFDAVSRTLYATRVKPPPFERPPEVVDDDEP